MRISFQTIKATANNTFKVTKEGAHKLYTQASNSLPADSKNLYLAGGTIAGLGLAYFWIKNKTQELENLFYKTSAQLSQKPIVVDEALEDSIEEVTLTTKDGIDLDCWDINPNNSDKYAIFMHGNCRNIGDEQKLYSELLDKGFGVFALEYRGYSNNKGKVNEEGLNADAQAAYDYLIDKGIEPKNIGAIGHSLGGAIACDLASKNELGFLVLDSTFNNAKDSMKSILHHEEVRGKFSIPQRTILAAAPISMAPIENRFKSDEKIGQVKCPILVIHCKGDDVIPYQLSKKLAGKAINAQYLEFATLGDSSIHNLTPEEIDKISSFAHKIIASDKTNLEDTYVKEEIVEESPRCGHERDETLDEAA